MAFDDDDSPLTTRNAQADNGHLKGGGGGGGDDVPSAEDALEDEMPDFKLFSAMLNRKGVTSKSIRKGEKDFESHGTQAQDGALESSRKAMEEVLGYTRVHRRDGWVRAWYFPEKWAGEGDEDALDNGLCLKDRVVVVEHEKGSWIKDIGRVVPSAKDPAIGARLWLLPEEALGLVERGTLDLWWPDRTLQEIFPGPGPADRSEFGPEDYEVGVPLSLEACYAMLIGEDGERGKVSLSKYQVYTHLKRSGFHILRAPPSTGPPEPKATPPEPALWERLLSLITWDRQASVNPWGPLVRPGLYRAYRPIYQRLAILPRHQPTIKASSSLSEYPEPEEPFRVFYHVWKTGRATFSKKNPPPPDFRIAVSNTSSSCVPDISQLDALLLSSCPYEPPPEYMRQNGLGKMYQRLKHGHRNVLIAVVDAGLVNFIRFGEGAFGEEKLYERFDAGPGRGGRKGGGGGGRGRGGARGRGRGRGRGRNRR